MTATCPMTGEPHLWGDWERVVTDTSEGREPTGDIARECRVCGRWDIEWAETKVYRIPHISYPLGRECFCPICIARGLA